VDIFDEAENILRNSQQQNDLEAKVEAQQRVIEIQQKIIDLLCKQQALFADRAFPGTELSTEAQAILKQCKQDIPDLLTSNTRFAALLDQLNAAFDELRVLNES
jgi:hypothetical protein